MLDEKTPRPVCMRIEKLEDATEESGMITIRRLSEGLALQVVDV